MPEMENSRDGKRSVSIRLSEKRTLIFRTDMRRNLPEWGNSVGGTRLDDFNLDFEVPWNDLLAGKPVTIKLPYLEDEEKGSWTIQFTPGR